jgi:hypothetical protein
MKYSQVNKLELILHVSNVTLQIARLDEICNLPKSSTLVKVAEIPSEKLRMTLVPVTVSTSKLHSWFVRFFKDTFRDNLRDVYDLFLSPLIARRFVMIKRKNFGEDFWLKSWKAEAATNLNAVCDDHSVVRKSGK